MDISTHEREVLDFLDVGILILDQSSHLLYANRVAREFFSLPEDYCGKSALSAIPIPYLAPYFSFDSLVLAHEGEFSTETVEEKKLILRVRACLFAGDSKPARGLVLFSDASQEKKMEEMKNEFASKISHEFRTPLTIIKGQLVNLQKERLGPLQPRQVKALDSAIENIERLHRMIHKLLDLSKYEAGRLRIHRRTVEPARLIARVVENLQARAREQGVTIDIDSSGDHGLIRVDTDLLEQVFINLIDNALRYAKAHIWIRFAPELEELDGADNARALLKIQVIDDGPGIPEDRLPELFHKFVQVGRSYGPGYKGTGLGLSIVREIVHLHYGRVWADNDESRGARINLVLPIYHEEAQLHQSIGVLLDQSYRGQRHLGLIALRFEGDRQVIKTYEDLAEKLQTRFLSAHEEVLLWTAHDTLFVLADRIYPKVLLLAEHIEDWLKSLSAEERFFSDFQLGVAFHPQDGTSPAKLIEACTAHSKPLAEVAEELSNNILLSGKAKAR